ncbi:hypothetical protein [Yinghuangia soli]|uniref:Uncharacterized protein n=1 Tax=Yinghuangia soli TaxID=2908204 RepID=A0AA41Q4Q5_9ACTN|nr:hypothetical protein [Yinghuangia soli]MCF2531157.1 hypothetical protein [Yinghuangia soli]
MAAYRQMWAAMLTAALTSDPTFADLERFAAGEALAKLRYSLTVDQQNGLTTKGPLHISAQATLTSGTTATINDCLDDTQWLKYKADGSLKDNIPGSKHHAEAVATLADGLWKITQLRVDGAGTC